MAIQFAPKPPVSIVPKAIVTLVLPFTGDSSATEKLRQFVSKCFPQVNLRVVFKPPRRLSNLFRFKDTIPFAMRSNIVYKYTCAGCNAEYVGQTSRHLHVRACEHSGISSLTGKPLSTRSNSSIFDHFQQTGHTIASNSFKIVSNGLSESDLLIREAIVISRLKPTLNAQATGSVLVLL